MSRKDFVLIAAVLNGTKANVDVVLAMARALAATNSRFDSDRFVRACGVKL